MTLYLSYMTARDQVVHLNGVEASGHVSVDTEKVEVLFFN